MGWNTTAAKELCDIIGEIITVMLEEVVGFWAVDGLERVEILEEDLLWKRGNAERDYFHGFAMVGSSGNSELDSLP